MCLTTLFAGPKAPHPLFLWHGVHVPTDDPGPHSVPFRCHQAHLVPPSFFHRNNRIIAMETLARSLELPPQDNLSPKHRKESLQFLPQTVSLTPISVMYPHLISRLKLPMESPNGDFSMKDACVHSKFSLPGSHLVTLSSPSKCAGVSR